ncbi:hypothetical protein MNBD_DELTA04-1367 [hydrothermal vent metagenome]|uniref:BPL/LPL catalytic domain-containing protein n=1 Tax=hydrothermal vent metagenome TaxID=652676 RepID=A0A3B0VLU8_9ZZZZ
MGVNPAPFTGLTPAAILERIESRELSRRCAVLPEDVVRKVFRYGATAGRRIEQHVRLDRCMDRLQDLVVEAERRGETLASGTVVMAAELGHGSGRFDRRWYAPPGGLWLAMAWADTLLPDFARLLPLAAGIACCETVRGYGIDAAIKWVNDIHVRDRKVCGILCQTVSAPGSGDSYHLIGIGINCNNKTFPAELRDTAVSMRDLLGRSLNLSQFALDLLVALAWNFGLVHFQEECELAGGGYTDKPESPVVAAWRQLSDTLGRQVVYGYDVRRRPLYRAAVLDIDHGGGLVMALEDGRRITEYSGEILYLDGNGLPASPS